MDPSMLSQFASAFASKSSGKPSLAPKPAPRAPIERARKNVPAPISWAPVRNPRRKQVDLVNLVRDDDSDLPNLRPPTSANSPVASARVSPLPPAELSPMEIMDSIYEEAIAEMEREARSPLPAAPTATSPAPPVDIEEAQKEGSQSDIMDLDLLMNVDNDEDDESAPPPAKRQATQSRVEDPKGATLHKMVSGMVPRPAAEKNRHPQKVSKTQLRRQAAKTQHSATPADDVKDLRNRLSDGEDEEADAEERASPRPMTAEEKLAERRRKDRERHKAKRKAEAMVRKAATNENVVRELTARLDRGRTTWKTPLMDPEHPKFNQALVLGRFTVENGFDLSRDRIDLVFEYCKPYYMNSEALFDGWCPLARVYVDELMANPVTRVERDRIADGNAHPETATRTRTTLLGPWFLLCRLSCCDPLLSEPVTTLWQLVRPARLFGLLCFLREYYSQPNRTANTFKNKLYTLQSLLKWLHDKPELKLSQRQIRGGLMVGRAGEAYVPPPQGTNAAILESFACATDAEANQATYWISCALEEIKKLLAFAADYARADPQARPNEAGLRKVGDWPSRELFKKTLRELHRRLEEFKETYFEYDEEGKRWSRKEAFRALAPEDQRRVFFEYQDYLLAVSIIALHGSRRQVAVHMSVQNMTYARGEVEAEVDGEPESGSSSDPQVQSKGNLATLGINFKEKVQSRRHPTLPLNDRYFHWFHIYHQAILPRISMPEGSATYWRSPINGLVMSPSAFSRIHQKIWQEVGTDVQEGDPTGVPTSFSPLQVRRWIITEFFNTDANEAELADYASIMNTSVDMMRKHYNRQKSEMRQVQITRTIGQMLEVEEEEERAEEDGEEA